MRLLNKFKKNICSTGTFSKCSDPAMIECIGLAGFDFVIIDLEHGPNSFETAQNLVRAAVIHNLTPVIRVGENSESMISKALDIGARGVQVPQVNSRPDALKVVDAAKFSPEGNRGVCRFVRAAGYSSIGKGEYFEQSNKQNLVIVHIEGKTGIENFEIKPVQRYDLSNHIYWMIYSKPGGMGRYNDVFHEKLNLEYKAALESKFICDTMFAVITKN